MAMTATCREPCCSVAPRLAVTELVERGLRRNREAPRTIVGAVCIGADDNTAAFSLDVVDGRIAAVGFNVSCCACEYIAQIAPSSQLALASALTATNLVDGVRGVPALKRDRALLAVAAFRAALMAADQPQRREPEHESRLHLRHPAP